MVYWGHLYYLPDGVIRLINSIIAKFLWGGAQLPTKIHLCKLQKLCRPKDHDGWGILDTRNFNIALLIKSFWRALDSDGIWNKVIKCKYVLGDLLHQILNNQITFPRRISVIWGSFKKIYRHMAVRVAWSFADGSRIPLAHM